MRRFTASYCFIRLKRPFQFNTAAISPVNSHAAYSSTERAVEVGVEASPTVRKHSPDPSLQETTSILANISIYFKFPQCETIFWQKTLRVEEVIIAVFHIFFPSCMVHVPFSHYRFV